MEVNSLISATLANIINKLQSVSIREVPVTTMDTLTTTATCGQVSMTLNTVTIGSHMSYKTKVHIGVVGQSLAFEGDLRKGLRVDFHQRPEET